MTATTDGTARAAATPTADAAGPATATALARTGFAEWSRMWSVRSTWLLTGATAVVVIGFGLLLGNDAADDPSGISPGSTAWDGGRMGGMFALFGILATAVVTTTADHTTGGIVPTLQWTPRRRVLLAARTLVVVLTTTLLGVVLVGAASVIIWALVPQLGLPADDGARTLGGLGYMFATGGLLAVGLGLLTRSTAAGLVTVIALMLVLPLLLAQMPYDWSVSLSARMPGSSALYLVFGEGPDDEMTTFSARLTLAGWAAAALVTGGWRLLRTDADR